MDSKKRMEQFRTMFNKVVDPPLDMRLVCPCIPFHMEHYDAMKRCWCGLYVHKGIDELVQTPTKDFGASRNIR